MSAFRVFRNIGNHEIIWDIMYDNFQPGWELVEEAKALLQLGITYREWRAPTSTTKGFVAKTFTKVLNEKRKEVRWIKRRETCNDIKNGVIKRIRNKHLIEFDPLKHLSVRGDGEQEGTTTTTT